MDYVKKYWKKVLVSVIIIIFPFVLELFLFITPVVSRFNNETWFSFICSYIGVLVTIGVMFVTFVKSDKENKKIIERQKKQHEIDRQNEKLEKIIHVLLLDNYYFLDPNTVGENIDKFIGDLHYVQIDTLIFKYVTNQDEVLIDELLKLQVKEVEIINEMPERMPHVDSTEKANELKIILLNMGLELSKIANLSRERIKIVYDNYLERVYKDYYD